MHSLGFRLWLIVAAIVVLVFGLSLLWTYVVDDNETSTYPYSQVLADAAAGDIEAITQEGTHLAVVRRGESEPRSVTIASESINVYAEVCTAAGSPLGDCPIRYTVATQSQAGQLVTLLITSLLPVLLIGSFVYFMMRQAQREKPRT